MFVALKLERTLKGRHLPKTWDLKPGDRIKRTELHQKYGGRGQGGISPSAKSKNVMIFTDPKTGVQHGYYDGWKDDGLFHYTGEGQHGDQTMTSGNRTVKDQLSEGRHLRLFQGAKGTVKYSGEMNYVGWYEDDAPATGDGPLRKVIVFKLAPANSKVIRESDAESAIQTAPKAKNRVTHVDVEARNTETFVQSPKKVPTIAERRESLLVQRFGNLANVNKFVVTRLQIFPKGEAKPMFTDVVLNRNEWLIEAKGTVTREAVRMAIGQLLDYSRFVEVDNLGILLPSKPRSDLFDLAATVNAIVIWEDAGKFVTPAGPFF